MFWISFVRRVWKRVWFKGNTPTQEILQMFFLRWLGLASTLRLPPRLANAICGKRPFCIFLLLNVIKLKLSWSYSCSCPCCHGCCLLQPLLMLLLLLLLSILLLQLPLLLLLLLLLTQRSCDWPPWVLSYLTSFTVVSSKLSTANCSS